VLKNPSALQDGVNIAVLVTPLRGIFRLLLFRKIFQLPQVFQYIVRALFVAHITDKKM